MKETRHYTETVNYGHQRGREGGHTSTTSVVLLTSNILNFLSSTVIILLLLLLLLLHNDDSRRLRLIFVDKVFSQLYKLDKNFPEMVI